MHHHIGETRFIGCQCIKDCTCNEDFTPSEYNYYTVTRKGVKTTKHETIEDANKRWDNVVLLPACKKQLNPQP